MTMELVTSLSDVTPIPDQRSIKSPRHSKKISSANVEKNTASKIPKENTLRDAIQDAMLATQGMRDTSTSWAEGSERKHDTSFQRQSPFAERIVHNIVNLSQWAKQNNLDKDLGCACGGMDDESFNAKNVVVASTNSKNSFSSSTGSATQYSQSSKSTVFQDLVWPLFFCGAGGSIQDMRNIQQQMVEPNLKQMKDAMSQVVKDFAPGDDIWRFAAPSSADQDDDDESVMTLDTLEAEANQMRRLGSWNTHYTAGTFATMATMGDATLLQELEDDDGNAINRELLRKLQDKVTAQKKKKKKVKFDYPPIKSLKTCPRPDPEDLPNLFFTPEELDLIEDDRYSTLNTDDVEIVAISPPNEQKEETRSDESNRGDASSSARDAEADSSSSNSSWRKRLGRSPLSPRKRFSRQQQAHNESSEEITESSDDNRKRLVMGVQIYLRERSTIA
jgi:hypothetical protein